jgi:hypothetical protein
MSFINSIIKAFWRQIPERRKALQPYLTKIKTLKTASIAYLMMN